MEEVTFKSQAGKGAKRQRQVRRTATIYRKAGALLQDGVRERRLRGGDLCVSPGTHCSVLIPKSYGALASPNTLLRI